ncbi:imidazolonepropionase-like amidohydrolase [Pseudorhizobium tarimense]|uniref:Imidazolonepropionase-like amidohydrolase n=1 Tax=Pseudorhizobium tarimense TaxID=1079109 RepID=A0ABV2HDI3_9HYPH|nr:amidohydrolase family protein [Pseudorhizobium tarimense]MCJ8521614.1 amidohydrolase family protein [Pseudorhizobium tarimense]
MESLFRLSGERVLVGPKLQAVARGAVLVSDGRIVAAGTEESVPTPDGCKSIALDGATIMPGLIDAHMHTFGVNSTMLHTLATEHEGYRVARALSELSAMLRAGFTAARCLGSTIGPQVRRAIEEGFAQGPDLKAAGAFISSTSGTWDTASMPLSAARAGGELADGPDALRRAVRERARQGADFIKLGLSKGRVHDRYHAWGDDPLKQSVTYGLEEVSAAVEEAHRNDLKVSAHAIGEESVRLALDGGVDIIEHGYGISAETRQRLVGEGKTVVTTLSQVHFHRQAFDEYRYPDWERAVYERHWNAMSNDFRLGLEAGIRFAFGTDLIGGPTHPLHEAAMEFLLAVELGMSEGDALVAGTVTAADVLGLAQVTGSIEVGKRADIVAVGGNPLKDITSVRRPAFVMQQGRPVNLAVD